MSKHGVLLINLGTPDNCDPASVRRYLKEFLTDPRVVDIPKVRRWLLLQLLFLRNRHKKSALAYQKIWTDAGSPLLVNSKKLAAALLSILGSNYQVELAMRYGQPSIESALAKLKDCHALTILPLFPQYSAAATGSALEAALKLVARQWNIPSVRTISDFYQHPGFIGAYVDMINQHIKGKNIDMLLFSYHGLPERHINKSACFATCDHLHACPSISDKNAYCYRAQCYATSDLIAHELHLTTKQCAVSFQSRLGRTPWIKPYTDQLLPDLIKAGIKHLAIVSPSFVSDCLETLEEINIRLRQQWLSLGGTDFTYIPCLNDSPLFVNALKNIIS